MFNVTGAGQFVKEEVGPPEDNASTRVYAAGARLEDLVDDLVEDLQEGRVGATQSETPVEDLLERLRRKQTG